MKKKVLAVLLATAMVLSMAACGGKGGDAEKSDGGDKAEGGDSKGYSFEIKPAIPSSGMWKTSGLRIRRRSLPYQ